jgi:hypothetical protein
VTRAHRLWSVIGHVGALAGGVVIWLLSMAVILFVVVGGMFYRTSCPSHVSWTFSPVPFLYVVKSGDTACSTDTATGFYLGKVPVAGGPLRAVVKNVTGQDTPG